MTLRADGRYRCDRCGVELENGGVHECVPATDLDGPSPVTYHFCRANGCAGKVLSKRNLAAFTDSKDT